MIDNIIEMIALKTNLLNRLGRLVSEHIYICGHSFLENENNNLPINHPYRNMVLAIQVSAVARARLGDQAVEGRCRMIVAVFQAIEYTNAERELIMHFRNVDNYLRQNNRNYVGIFPDLERQLFTIFLDRSHLIDFNHDVNRFYIIQFYQDGTLRYRYFF